MSDTAISSFKVEGLENLLKALNQKAPLCRVGIINDSSTRTGVNTTNAEVGAAHEFGSEKKNIPPRSFLRVPIANGLQPEMERCGLFGKQVLRDVVNGGTVKPWLELVAACAEKCVADAFATGGPGWPAWRNPDYTNNTGMLLVDTTQLRDSIKSEVK